MAMGRTPGESGWAETLGTAGRNGSAGISKHDPRSAQKHVKNLKQRDSDESGHENAFRGRVVINDCTILYERHEPSVTARSKKFPVFSIRGNGCLRVTAARCLHRRGRIEQVVPGG